MKVAASCPAASRLARFQSRHEAYFQNLEDWDGKPTNQSSGLAYIFIVVVAVHETAGCAM